MSADPDGGDESGGRLGGTIAGALAVAVIVGLGIWLVNEMADSARYSKCAAARHRNCDQLDYRREPPQQ
jgi:hypothetical protein